MFPHSIPTSATFSMCSNKRWECVLELEDTVKVLFIGGTGIISSACVALAAARGIELVLLNRGNGTRAIPANVSVLQGDIRDKDATARLLQDITFDVVADFV